jgi:multisubunit Na+/H+ antiporter MnhC subunit
VTDFEPTTDLPERIDADDTPVASTAQARDRAIQVRRKRILRVVLVGLAVVFLLAEFSWWRVLVGLGLMYMALNAGFAVIGAFARPVPEPPPPGELRRVKLTYRCTECGAELRMTLAADEIPAPPRHCSGDMDLIATREDGL